MRIVSWNCHDNFRCKFGHLERLQPDIAVIQEVGEKCLERAGLHDRSRSHWVGDTGQKGLAVIGYGEWKLSDVPARASERWFVPCSATNGRETVNLVGAWLNPAKWEPQDYVSPTLRALDQLSDFISSGPRIVAGDFNQSTRLDNKYRLAAGRRFLDTRNALASYGLTSAWHALHSDEHGDEKGHTYYHYYKEENKFHIDFVFGSPDLKVQKVEIGSYEKYAKISDHMPLTVDYAFSKSGA